MRRPKSLKAFMEELAPLLAGAVGGDPPNPEDPLDDIVTFEEIHRWLGAVETTFFCEQGKRSSTGERVFDNLVILKHCSLIEDLAAYLWPRLKEVRKEQEKKATP
jgi:hypothetical protein